MHNFHKGSQVAETSIMAGLVLSNTQTKAQQANIKHRMEHYLREAFKNPSFNLLNGTQFIKAICKVLHNGFALSVSLVLEYRHIYVCP